MSDAERQRVIARRFTEYERAWRAGKRMAIVDALDDCRKFDIAPPAWVVLAAKTLAQIASTDRRDRIHFMRWDAVRELRDRREELARPVRLPGGKWKYYEPTWEAAYEHAAEMLRGTIAKGGADAIKASYQKVNRAIQSGKAARYFVSAFDEKTHS